VAVGRVGYLVAFVDVADLELLLPLLGLALVELRESLELGIDLGHLLGGAPVLGRLAQLYEVGLRRRQIHRTRPQLTLLLNHPRYILLRRTHTQRHTRHDTTHDTCE
jgi:hypothetical protein